MRGVERAQTEDFAHTSLIRAALRFSRLNRPKPKFSSYAYSFVSVAVARWCQNDAAGGVSLRAKTADDDDTEQFTRSRSTPATQVDTASNRGQVGRVKDALTDTEFALLQSYADGEVDPRNEKLQAVLVKAQRAVQLPARMGYGFRDGSD
jgi:hypothetical protein